MIKVSRSTEIRTNEQNMSQYIKGMISLLNIIPWNLIEKLLWIEHSCEKRIRKSRLLILIRFPIHWLSLYESFILHYERSKSTIFMQSNKHIFISYAHENKTVAERLYMDLRRNHIDVWLDSKNLLPGQNWKQEIQNKITTASFFLLLISKHSINKRGFVQKEIKEALEVLDEMPTNEIFIIPVRIDNTQPRDKQLQNINWVDLFPDYEQGFSKIFRAISQKVNKEPLFYLDPQKQHIRFKENLTSLFSSDSNPYSEVWESISKPGVASRAPISYTPFNSFEEFARQLLEQLPESAVLFNPRSGLWLTIDTQHEEVVMPNFLKEKYPTEITIVLQHVFTYLQILENRFIVALWFNEKKEYLEFPYSSIKLIDFKEMLFSIHNNAYA